MAGVLILHGPNLNRLGQREPERYGRVTLAEIDAGLVALGAELGVRVQTFQSNWEGALVDRLQEGGFEGVVVNAGGLTHTSVVLRDALLAMAAPFVEVHLTNLHAREDFRQRSLLADVASGIVMGMGAVGYSLALRGLVAQLRASQGG